MGPAQHAYIIACCHVITSDYQGGTEPKSIDEALKDEKWVEAMHE